MFINSGYQPQNKLHLEEMNQMNILILLTFF